MKNTGFQKERRSHTVLTVVFAIIAVAYLYPIFIVLVNSLKTNAAINLDTFAFPRSDTFMGLQNYIKGMTFGNYPFYKSVEYSLMITLLSAALILICTSMAAWYISRVDSLVCRIVYYLCVFSMVVPFQMVMFTLAKTADTLKLNRPWTIPIVYLGFGAGLAVFMFTGFVKSIPRSIEEAAVIDGCTPVQTFFQVVLPMMKPTFISVGVLEIMWVWNDYLLPYLVLDINEFRTIPIHIQYLKGSYGSDPDVHRPGRHLLSLLPEIYYQGRCCRRGKGIKRFVCFKWIFQRFCIIVIQNQQKTRGNSRYDDQGSCETERLFAWNCLSRAQ
jgi:raffinose/stachyose/melibiose transport system permease protein